MCAKRFFIAVISSKCTVTLNEWKSDQSHEKTRTITF